MVKITFFHETSDANAQATNKSGKLAWSCLLQMRTGLTMLDVRTINMHANQNNGGYMGVIQPVAAVQTWLS